MLNEIGRIEGERLSHGEKRQQILREINRRLAQEGLTKEDIEAISERLVAPGWSVGDFVEAGMASGEVVWWGNEEDEKRLRLVTSILAETMKKIRDGGVSPDQLKEIENLSIMRLTMIGQRFSTFGGFIKACLFFGLLKTEETADGEKIIGATNASQG